MPLSFEQLGPYRIGKKLGQGGMGAVYAGVDSENDRPVAIKVLAPSLAAEEGFRARFEAEIESLKKLRHPNIVRLFGYGEQDGVMFYAMELVDGTSLEEELRHGRRFNWREATQIGIKICRALKHAHDHGIIHRDIKPANIMLASDGDVKLSDFGIARLFGNTSMTGDGSVLGTAEYMAPEQADGRPVTDRCDQYSLGGVLYALLSGKPPFKASTFVEMLQKQRYQEPHPVRRFAPDTPLELERIITQLLAKDPAKRFSNTLILARSLEAMEKGLSLSRTAQESSVSEEHGPISSALTGADAFAATLIPGESSGREAVAVESPPVPEGSRSAAPTAQKFIKVTEHEPPRARWWNEVLSTLLTLHSLLLLGALVALVALGWNLLTPPSADQLYMQISTVSSEGSIDRLRTASDDIDSFLIRFSKDPRSQEIRELQAKLEVDKRNRTAILSSRKLGTRLPETPLELYYLEAHALASTNPEVALVKFQAILDVFSDPVATDVESQHFVELARQELERLRTQVVKFHEEELRVLQERIAEAKRLDQNQPGAGRKIWQGIVTLYAERPWAASLVSEARQALEVPPSQDKK